MKGIITVFAFTLSSATFAQRIQAGINVDYDIPVKQVMSKMSNNGGEGFFVALQPLKKIPAFITFDMSHGNYSNQTINQTFLFSNQNSSSADVKYVSNFNRVLVGIQLYQKNPDGRFRLYLNLKAGTGTMKSKITMIGSSDPSCLPVQASHDFYNEKFIFSAGSGILINMSRDLNLNSSVRSFFDIGISFIGGSQFDYVNAKFIPSGPLGSVDGANSQNADGSRNISEKLENIFSGEVVNDKIAEVYTSAMSMISFHVGYTVYFVHYRPLIN